MLQGHCEDARVLAAVKRNPIVANGPAIFPQGTATGGNLLHGAVQFGCWDVALRLIIEYGADPEEKAKGMGNDGLTPHGFGVKKAATEVAEGK
jgi:hypothetical protein